MALYALSEVPVVSKVLGDELILINHMNHFSVPLTVICRPSPNSMLTYGNLFSEKDPIEIGQNAQVMLSEHRIDCVNIGQRNCVWVSG